MNETSTVMTTSTEKICVQIFLHPRQTDRQTTNLAIALQMGALQNEKHHNISEKKTHLLYTVEAQIDLQILFHFVSVERKSMELPGIKDRPIPFSFPWLLQYCWKELFT